MIKDPIVEEIRRARAEYSAQFPTLEAMVKDIQRREAISRARGVKFADPPKRKKPRGKTASKNVG